MSKKDALKNLPAFQLLELTLYAEAEGETQEGQEAVAWVIKHRAMRKLKLKPPIDSLIFTHAISQVDAIAEVILAPYQFSCFNEDSPRWTAINKFLNQKKLHSKYWKIVRDVLFVKTCPHGFITHYLRHDTKPWPTWATDDKFAIQIGAHKFYANVD
jgi:spore germination cell wall hydrolase CwlJ-like protein